MATVFGITELLENLLHYVDVATLMRLQRVNRQWHSVVQYLIETDPRIRKHLFLTPTDFEDATEGCDDAKIFVPQVVHGNAGVLHFVTSEAPVVLNPFFKYQQWGHHLSVRGDELLKLSDPSDFRRNMFVSQPPLFRMRWQMALHRGQTAEQMEKGQHQAVSVLTEKDHSDSTLPGNVTDVMEMVKKDLLARQDGRDSQVSWEHSILWFFGRVMAKQEYYDMVAESKKAKETFSATSSM